MHKYILIILSLLFLTLVGSAQSEPSVVAKIAEKIKVSGDIQFRYEQSMTDSVNAQGKYAADPTNYNFRIRRSRIRLDAQVTKKLSATVRFALQDFASSNPGGRVFDYGYFDYKFSDGLVIRAGQFKSPFSAEELQSSNDLPVIDRGLTNGLFGDNEYLALQQGLMIHGKFKDFVLPLNYYAGVFNGTGRNQRLDENSGKNWVGRIELIPLDWLELGLSGEYADLKGEDNGSAMSTDITLDHYFNDKYGIWLRSEYLYGNNQIALQDNPLFSDQLSDFIVQGWYTTLLFKIKPGVDWLKEIELGGRYEQLDPVVKIGNNTITQITPNIGLVFAEDNAARWQFNLVRTIYEEELPHELINSWLFVTQFQVRF